MAPDYLFGTADAVLRELALFAGLGFALFGLDEIAVDAIFLARGAWRALFPLRGISPATAETLPAASKPGRLAIFVPAWDEAAVIEAMLGHLLDSYNGAAFDAFVGCYPNDPATVAAATRVVSSSIQVIVGNQPGPTTKADCLNQLWHAMRIEEKRGGLSYKGIVLHDAEDMVSAAELPVFDWALERFDLVQLPVIPVVDPSSRWIGGHYCDEFAEAHGKTLIVRELLGAAVPSAGVGCGIKAGFLARIAENRGGKPFDAETLTEDYELGLHIRALGGKTAFMRLPSGKPPGIVGTCAHFPATIDTAVRQKTRWMIGIALAGWDRLGWRGGIGERWMRWRDRRAILAAILLICGYFAALLFVVLFGASILAGHKLTPPGSVLAFLLNANATMLCWRILMRAWCVNRLYGWREALFSIPRMVVGNVISIMAARRAVVQYWKMLRGGALVWDKTAHVFPTGQVRR